ncbi:secreted ookinete protein, putative [Plasmodium reichenowi]|uniref:Secreted ookinete protein, putative n=1 Tax=Plasmodium reichenowi TaxID=5854 RepID=A0A2P9D9S1_PLARE|nr:secreted ookinete protein, putative [Plasmodium reichenowi]
MNKMNKIICLMLYVSLVNWTQSKNIVSSFIKYINYKINTPKEISKVIKMGNTLVCLNGNNNYISNECSCLFKTLKDFEKNCSSNLKKNQQEAKLCAEERCEICCNLKKNEYQKYSSHSILQYELDCKKKCTKSKLISEANEQDYKIAFKKIIELIRIFFPVNVLNYYPISNKGKATYTNQLLNHTDYDKIRDDLNSETIKENIEYEENLEDKFSPYNEN